MKCSICFFKRSWTRTPDTSAKKEHRIVWIQRFFGYYDVLRGDFANRTNRIITEKCLRQSGDCGILNIKKDICANRCPTGTTDRRLARFMRNSYSRFLCTVGGYFCVLLLSLPKEYPIPKQVKPKLSTAISPKISIWLSPPFPDSLTGFYVIGGSQSLQRGLTAYHLGRPRQILP